MNTLLPTDTIKSLKMIATAVCLTVVFVLATNVTSAQVIDARYATPEVTGQKPVLKQEADQNNPASTNIATGSVETKTVPATIETGVNTSTVKPASVSPVKVNAMMLAKPELTKTSDNRKYKTETVVEPSEKQ